MLLRKQLSYHLIQTRKKEIENDIKSQKGALDKKINKHPTISMRMMQIYIILTLKLII